MFLGQLYNFTSWKCTIMSCIGSTFQKTSSSCSVSASTSACMELHQNDGSIPTCFCNRGTTRVRSTARGQLNVPHTKKATYGRRGFSFASPFAWNSLSNYLKDCSFTLVMFKRSLKTFCFQSIRTSSQLEMFAR